MAIFFSNFGNVCDALGWALIHFLWQGLLLFICYWIITRVIIRNRIHIQYWLGIAFIVLCLIIPIREFFIQLGTSNNFAIVQQLGLTVGIMESSGILSPLDIFIAIMQKFIPYLVILWMISVLLISSNLTRSWFALIKLSKQYSFEIPENLTIKLNFIAKELKLKFKPIISISKKIDIPATFGFFKPVILLPTALINRLPPEQMEAILLHEMCHIKRADFLHNILQLLVETLFFYHPLTKWISRDIRKVREQCCDELVLKLKVDPLVYAKSLTNIAVNINNLHKNAANQLQVAANDGELLNRIKFLMLERNTKSSMANIKFGLILTILLLFIFNNFTNNKTSLTTSTSLTIIDSPKIKQAKTKPEYSIPNIRQLLQQEFAAIKTQQLNNQAVMQKKLTKFVMKIAGLPESSITTKEVLPPAAIELAVENIMPMQENSTTDSIGQTIFTSVNNKPINFANTITSPAKRQIAFNNHPRLIKKVNPLYKRSLRAMEVEGTVILSFNISQTGRVKNIRIDKNSPMNFFDSSAKVALKKWRFDPKTLNSSNISNRYQQIFSFELDKIITCDVPVTGTRLKNKSCK